MPDLGTTAVSGVEARGYRRGGLATDDWDQYVIPVRDRITSFTGRAAAFTTPGRAAVLQRLICVHNATASPVRVAIPRIDVDMLQTGAAVAFGVVPGIIQAVRFTAAPTGGTVLAKGNPGDQALASNASVVATGDASAHGTLSTTALTVAAGATLDQKWSPRLVQTTATAANSAVSEMHDPTSFVFSVPEVLLGPTEGVAIQVDQATLTTGNPATNRWLVTLWWEEFTRP